MDLQMLILKLSELENVAMDSLKQVQDEAGLEQWRVEYLGKKSVVTALSRQVGRLGTNDRPQAGERINRVRQTLQEALQTTKIHLEELLMIRRLEAERLDITLPGRRHTRGAMHPLSRIVNEIEEVFLGMGFTIAEGPEVESDAYNFEKLNIPKDHPARDMQDTFYLTDTLLMRTHTSPMQVRTMEKMAGASPVKVIVPGRVYRRDADDATHSHAFQQIEGLVVDKGIRMSDLKGILEEFARAVFGPHQAVRLRPSFFPFTEPSAEVDVRCIACGGSGCRMCKDTGWIEILGAGMVHPNVLDWAGYDSRVFSGFAFGMGPDRIALLKYGIEDIRMLYQNDLRLLEQFERVF